MRVALVVVMTVVTGASCASSSPARRPHTKSEKSAPAPVAKRVPAPPPSERCLVDPSAAHCARRAVLARCGASAVEPDGMKAPDAACTQSRPLSEELAVIEEDGELVRVMTQYARIRYAVFIQRKDLALRPIERVKLTAGVTLLPGAPITVLGRDQRGVEVAVDADGIRTRGRLAASTLGRVYTPEVLPAWPTTVEIATATEMTADVGGPVIAKLTADNVFVRRSRLVRKHGSHVLIEVATPSLRLRGYVPAAAVRLMPGGSLVGFGGGRGFGGWTASHTLFLSVPKHTTIHTAPGANPFARTLGALAVVALSTKRDGEWVRVNIQTGWRMVSGWVRCPGIVRHPTRTTAFRCTSADDPKRLRQLPRW